MAFGACLHCGLTRRLKGRSLCPSCYQRPGVKEQYQLVKKSYRPKGYEPTEEELNVMIAEQLQRKPRWYVEEEERRRRGGR